MEEPHLNSADSFSLGSFDLGAVCSPKRFDWMRMNLDTGAAVNTYPPDSGPDGPGDGRFCRRASGERAFWMVELGNFKAMTKKAHVDL